MKNGKQWIISIVAVLVVGVTAWLLWPKDSLSYVRVIPADATALMSVDVADVLEECDINKEKVAKLFPKMQHIENIGLDLQKPVYAFASATGMGGVLAAVDHEDQFRSFLEEIKASPIEEQQGYSWSIINDMFVLGFNDEVALLMGPTILSNQAEVRQQMLSYLKQSKNESVMTSPLYPAVQKQDGLLKAVCSLNLIPEYYQMFQNMGLPDHVDYSKILMTIAMEAPKGRVVLHSELIAEDKSLAQKMKALDDMIRPIEGEFLTSMLPNTLFWACANVQGEKFMKMLTDMPALRLYLMAMNHVMDVEQMLRKIDGDIALAIAADKQLSWQVQAQVSDLSFMNEVDYWMAAARRSRSYKFEKVDEDLYSISSLLSHPVYLGINDKNVLFSSDRAAMDCMQGTHKNIMLDSYRKDIQKSKFYVWAQLSEYPQFMQWMGLHNEYDALMSAQRVLDKIDAVALRSTKATSMDLILYLKDKNSGLKQLFE